MFGLSIEFLVGRCYAARWEDPTQPDWPIDSSRVFSAMVAALSRLRDPADVAAAKAWLGWLERLPPPAIICVPRPEGLRCDTTHAPRPVKAKNQKHNLMVINPRTDPLVLTSTPLLDSFVFIQYDAELATEDRPLVERLLANVTYVGASESVVRVRIALPGEEDAHPLLARYVPREGGDLALRTPHPGRLAHLVEAYAEFQRPDREAFEPRAVSQGRFVRYSVAQLEAAPLANSDMDEIVPLVFAAHGKSYGPDLDSLRFASATKAVRSAFLRGLGPVNPFAELTGHDEDGSATKRDHVAFVPLCEVGFDYARSRLRGVGLVIPRAFDAEMRERALRAFRVSSIRIEGKDWPVAIDREAEVASLKPGRYCVRSRTWVTATPIVLPRYARGKQTVASILALAIERTGLPTPLAVETSHVPFVEGAYPASQYRSRVPDAPGIVHARMTWGEPVRGPVLLGLRRHEGYGLCLPSRRDVAGVAC